MTLYEKIVQRIFSSGIYLSFKKATKKIVLPGFDGVPLFDVIVFFIRGLVNGAITTRASSIAFKLFMAIFPAIIFIFTLIPYIPAANFQVTLLEQINNALPANTYAFINATITDIVSRQQGGLLSFGFIMALYFASNGFLGLISAFNNTAHNIETRGFFQQYMISIFLMLIISVLIIISITLILIGQSGLQYLFQHDILNGSLVLFLLKAGRWLVVLCLVFFAISFLYYLAPAKRERFRFISAGSSLATLLFLLTTLGFNYYVNNFGKYNALYGSIGTIIIIMMWLYLNSVSLLIGFELNVSIHSVKKQLKS